MRVIAGVARGHKLQPVPGESTRPITDRVKEALFNILSGWIEESVGLDLFGGTGAVGIEALSRGAQLVTFVERNRRALAVLRANLQHTKLADAAVVIAGDAFRYLQRRDIGPYDWIYVAPPQYHGLWLQALRQIDARPCLLTEDGLVVVQIHPKEELAVADLRHLILADRRKYGSTLLLFYQQQQKDAGPEGRAETDALAENDVQSSQRKKV